MPAMPPLIDAAPWLLIMAAWFSMILLFIHLSAKQPASVWLIWDHHEYGPEWIVVTAHKEALPAMLATKYPDLIPELNRILKEIDLSDGEPVAISDVWGSPHVQCLPLLKINP